MDNLQQALVEQIVDTVTDFRLEIFKAVFEFDEVRKVLLGDSRSEMIVDYLL